MKNIFRLLMAALVICATSCTKEDVSSTVVGNGEVVEVNFSANLSELGTRVTTGSGAAADRLLVNVFDAANGNQLTELSRTDTRSSKDESFNFSLPLVKGMTYDIVLWADMGDDSIYTLDGKVVTADYSAAVKSNDENLDAFCFVFKGFDPTNPAHSPHFTLRRPFAQLNAATNDKAAVTASGIELTTSEVKVLAYNQFDIFEGTVPQGATKAEVSFGAANIPGGDLNGNATYEYLSANYLFVPATGALTDAVYTFKGKKTNSDVVTFTGTSYSAIPLKPNHRTNILGALLTKPTDFVVDVEAGFAPSNEVVNVVTTASELQDAIKNGSKNVKLANDITVDEWIMFSETKNIGTGQIITVEMNGLNIDGNGHTLTVNSIESAGNGNLLFDAASNLNISNLTIKKNCDGGAISLVSGVIKNVNFVGGGYGIHPGAGEIKIEGCTFATADGDAIYSEHERDNLTVTGCTFNQLDSENVILIRGDVEFTNNIINSGRTVNIVSGSPLVDGNNFHNVRLKVYAAATATISNNIIGNLVFETGTHASTFINNTFTATATVPENNTADVVLSTGTVNVTVPADKASANDSYKVEVRNESTTTDSTAGETTVAFDLTLYKNDVQATGDTIYEVAKNIGAGKIIAEVTHNGTALTKADTGADQTYTYDSATGVLTIYTKSFSPFEITYADYKDYERGKNFFYGSYIGISTGSDFLPIFAMNPEITKYSVFEGDTRITDKVIFRFSNVKKETIDENSYKVSVNLAIKDDKGNELELKPGMPSTINEKEYLHVYMNLIEVPAGYSVSEVKVNGVALTKSTKSNPGTGGYMSGIEAKDLYFQSKTAGLIEVTLTK